MPRFHTKGILNADGMQIGQENIQFTTDEETAANSAEATIAAAQPLKNWDMLRMERNAKLAKTDWTQYNDSPLTDEVKAEWTVHRQALRDLPANTDDPANPTWPTPPG